eukprot:UN32787
MAVQVPEVEDKISVILDSVEREKEKLKIKQVHSTPKTSSTTSVVSTPPKPKPRPVMAEFKNEGDNMTVDVYQGKEIEQKSVVFSMNLINSFPLTLYLQFGVMLCEKERKL